MLVVVASRFDADAAGFVRLRHGAGARLLTCDGVTRRGWCFFPHDPERSLAMLEGEAYPVRAICGVVSRLPYVFPDELTQIVAEERAYVAAEVMAFLVAWLAWLPCPVWNRPSPLDLTGPGWHHEQWLHHARRCGLAVCAARRPASGCSKTEAAQDGATAARTCAEPFAVSMVDGLIHVDAAHGPIDDSVRTALRRLAQGARVELMTARFCRIDRTLVFCGAHSGVDLGNPDIANALAARLVASP